MLPKKPIPERISDDVVYGAAALADFILGDKSQTKRIYYLASRGAIPIFRMGRGIAGRKSEIAAAMSATREVA